MARMDALHVESVDALISALEGPKRAAETLAATPQRVVNWRADNRIPSKLYLAHTAVLEPLGIVAPASLWGMAAIQEPAE